MHLDDQSRVLSPWSIWLEQQRPTIREVTRRSQRKMLRLSLPLSGALKMPCTRIQTPHFAVVLYDEQSLFYACQAGLADICIFGHEGSPPPIENTFSQNPASSPV